MPFTLRPFAPRGANIHGDDSLGASPRQAIKQAHRRHASRKLGAASLGLALVGTLFAGSFGAVAPSNAIPPGTGTGTSAGLIGTNAVKTKTAEGAEDPATPQLVVAPQEPVFAVAADEYVFTVLVRNPLKEELPGGTLSLQLTNDRLENAGALTELESGTNADEMISSANTTQLAEVDVDPTDAEGEQSFTITVASADLPLNSVSAAGVYGAHAELHLESPVAWPTGTNTDTVAPDAADSSNKTADQAPEGTRGTPEAIVSLTSTTTFVWRGQAFGQRLPLTLVVPMLLPDSVRSMPTRADLGDAVPRLDELLTEAEKWQATLAIDPRIIAGIRAYGDAAPESARDLLTRLETTPLPMFLLQFADADPAVQAELGFDELMQPVGLSFLTRLGSFETPTLDDTSTEGNLGSGNTNDTNAGNGVKGNDGSGNQTDPAPSDDAAGDPQPPDLAQLLDWPQESPGAWPANGEVDAKTLSLLQKSGINQLVLESGNVTGAKSARAQIGSFDALIASESLDDAAAVAIGGETEAERAGGLALLAANLAFRAQPAVMTSADSPTTEPAAMVLALDRGAIADAESPAQVMQGLAELDWVKPLAAEDLDQSSGALKPGKSAAERTKLLTETMKRSEEIDNLSPLLEHPGYLVQYQRTRMLNVLASRYAEPTADFAAIDRATRSRDKKLLAGVKVVPSEDTQLVGTPSNVPVLVRNSLPFDAIITLRASPTSAALTLPELRFADELVAADSNSTVLVPVRTRVSSGSSGLLVQVADNSDDAVFDASVLHLTIRSSFETILLITLGALAVVLFGLGVWRSILRRRSARAAAGEANPELHETNKSTAATRPSDPIQPTEPTQQAKPAREDPHQE